MKQLLLYIFIFINLQISAQNIQKLDLIGEGNLNVDPYFSGRLHYSLSDIGEPFTPHAQFAVTSDRHIQFKSTLQVTLNGKESTHYLRLFPFWYNRNLDSAAYNTPIGIEWAYDWKKFDRIYITMGADYYTNGIYPYLAFRYKIGTIDFLKLKD